MLMLGSLFLLGPHLRACSGSRLPSRGLGVPPSIRVRVASVLGRVLIVLVWLEVSASSSSTLTFDLPLPESLPLSLPPPLPEPLPGFSPFSFADRRCLG